MAGSATTTADTEQGHGQATHSVATHAPRIATAAGRANFVPPDGLTLVGSLGAVAARLLVSAWLALLPTFQVPAKVRPVAALPGILGIALVVAGVAAVVAFAATAPGTGQQILDFYVMLSLSHADWDKPPGSGYPTVALLVVATLATVAFWAVAGRVKPEPSTPPRPAPDIASTHR